MLDFGLKMGVGGLVCGGWARWARKKRVKMSKSWYFLSKNARFLSKNALVLSTF